jgi:hypothetical protein
MLTWTNRRHSHSGRRAIWALNGKGIPGSTGSCGVRSTRYHTVIAPSILQFGLNERTSHVRMRPAIC